MCYSWPHPPLLARALIMACMSAAGPSHHPGTCSQPLQPSMHIPLLWPPTTTCPGPSHWTWRHHKYLNSHCSYCRPLTALTRDHAIVDVVDLSCLSQQDTHPWTQSYYSPLHLAPRITTQGHSTLQAAFSHK